MSQTAEVAETIEGKVLRARAVARARLDAIRERKAHYDVDLEAFAGDCLTLRPVGGDEVLFRFNAVQRIVHEACEDQLRRTGKVRKLILKARKPGVSTYVGGRYYHKTSRKRGRKAFVLTQIDDSTNIIFGIYERFHQKNPQAPHTGRSNAKELYFDELDSGITVGTAGSKALGRGDTIQYFHGSEVAFWPNAQVHATGALEAVPDVEGTEIILESTANGASGLFYNYAQAALRGQGQYEIIFVPWFAHGDYVAKPPADWRPPETFIEYAFLHKLKRPQLYWAYQKNAALAAADNKGPDEICWQFMQEFPSTAEEAFRASRAGRFISGKDVLRARKTEAGDQSHAALVIGADFATGGDNEGGDANCFIDRQGRRAGRNVYDRFRDRNTVSVANKLGELITRLKPRMVFMDTGGGGAQVYDILSTRGFQSRMTLVNFGSAARNDKRYANKRAEMWGECRAWLTDPGGAQIPDDDVLDGELTAPKGKEDMNQRVLLEPKDKIRKEFGTSPDGADALCLTFAEPVSIEKDNTAAVAAAAAVQAADTTAGY